MPPRATSPWLPWALAGLAVAVFAITWWADFAYDDYPIVVRDERVHSPARWHELWTHSYWNKPRGANLSNWRPLTSTTYAINWALAGRRPWTFHLVNTLLHAGVTLAVFALACEILGRERPAAVAAALFAVHPLHTEAVANVVGRAEVMAALFALLSWLAHRRGHPLWAAVWLALGLLSKESALPIVGVMVFDDLLGRPGGRVKPRWTGRAWIPLALVFALYILARWAVLGSVGRNEGMAHLIVFNPLLGDGLALLTRWSTAIKMLAYQWALFVWPAKLLADYSWRHVPLSQSPLDPPVIASLLFFTLLVMLALTVGRRRPAVNLALGAWLLLALLSSNLLFPIGVLFAERLLYLPSVGMCLFVGSLLSREWSPLRPALRRVFTAVVAVALLALSARAVRRAWDWRDTLSLWQHDIRLAPQACQVQSALGIELKNLGQHEEARRHLMRACDLSRASDDPSDIPRHEQALEELADLLLVMAEEARHSGDEGRAAELLEEADIAIAFSLTNIPNNPVVLTYYAIRLTDEGDRERAEEIFRAALRLDDTSHLVLCNWAQFLLLEGRVDEAREVLRRAAELHPDSERVRELMSAAEAMGSP
ncbi:tetratricopeptide repeat protein [Candidatus Sumerlaeota bacterium]|nr:tetratricopeptide repeat protein [Candidatus Sumerlaeota bacterium]